MKDTSQYRVRRFQALGGLQRGRAMWAEVSRDAVLGEGPVQEFAGISWGRDSVVQGPRATLRTVEEGFPTHWSQRGLLCGGQDLGNSFTFSPFWVLS